MVSIAYLRWGKKETLSELADKSIEIVQPKDHEKKKIEKICSRGIPEGEERKGQNIFYKLMIECISNFTKSINLQIQ